MEININNNERSGQLKRSGVTIDPRPKITREMLDRDGNVIDPRTKQIIKRAEDNK